MTLPGEFNPVDFDERKIDLGWLPAWRRDGYEPPEDVKWISVRRRPRPGATQLGAGLKLLPISVSVRNVELNLEPMPDGAVLVLDDGSRHAPSKVWRLLIQIEAPDVNTGIPTIVDCLSLLPADDCAPEDLERWVHDRFCHAFAHEVSECLRRDDWSHVVDPHPELRTLERMQAIKLEIMKIETIDQKGCYLNEDRREQDGLPGAAMAGVDP